MFGRQFQLNDRQSDISSVFQFVSDLVPAGNQLLQLSSFLLESPAVTAPATVEVLPGSRAALWCTVKTGAPAKVQWIMDRRTLGPVVTRIGTANVTHTIPSVTNEDKGPYSCFASNVGGTATAVTTVIVKGKS